MFDYPRKRRCVKGPQVSPFCSSFSQFQQIKWEATLRIATPTAAAVPVVGVRREYLRCFCSPRCRSGLPLDGGLGEPGGECGRAAELEAGAGRSSLHWRQRQLLHRAARRTEGHCAGPPEVRTELTFFAFMILFSCKWSVRA